jgi:plasmid maintenance system antidote protein VapI
MEKMKRERLLADGWKVSTAAEFLGLSPEEESLVEARIALTRRIRSVREEKGMTQVQVARLIGSSQSRVAKMEAADRTVSIDMMMRTLFRLGQTPLQVGRALAG